MLNTKTSILGLSLSTRMMGIAVLNSGELIEWKTITFKKRWTTEKQKAIVNTIKGFIQCYSVSKVAMKGIHVSRSSVQLLKLENEIKEYCGIGRIRIRQFSISQIRAFQKTPLYESNELLQYESCRQQEIKSPYYMKVFEAVALAQMGFEAINKLHAKKSH